VVRAGAHVAQVFKWLKLLLFQKTVCARAVLRRMEAAWVGGMPDGAFGE
jgi:hypothetical protein